MKTLNTIILCCTLVLMASCELIVPDKVHEHTNTDNGLSITQSALADDYTRTILHIDQLKDLDKYNLTDSAHVTLKVKDSYCHLIPFIEGQQPTIKSIRYVVPEAVQREGITALVLVDLSQPSPVLVKEKEYVIKMRTIFCHDNLYLAFMLPGGTVTNIMAATDYIVDNYIDISSPLLNEVRQKSSASEGADSLSSLPVKNHAHLFRSVSNMLYHVSGHTGTVLDHAQKKLLVILSDGQIYDEATNMPLDPDHFAIQERLINQSHNLPDNAVVFYLNLAKSGVKTSVKDMNMMRMLCMRSAGKYMADIDWGSFLDEMLQCFRIHDDDYVMELRNTEGKIFLGSMRNLEIKAYRAGTDTILGETNIEYTLGSVSNPIIIGDDSYLPIYISGILIALLTIALIYITMQIIVPFVRYRIFRSRYVVQYTGKNMSVQGRIVSNTCYFCKAPFQLGDHIVAKCNHTMHEECWHENDQHCPEYGKNCPDGAHFYDAQNILNPRNGSHLIKWIVPSVALSALAWIFMAYFDHVFALHIVERILDAIKSTKSDNINIDTMGGTNAIMAISPHMFMLPLFGFYLTPLLTILFASLASYHRPFVARLTDVLLRGAITMFVSILVFFTESFIVLINDVYDGSVLVDWIPWTIATYTVLTASTYNTRINTLHNRTKVIVSLAMGVVNALLWDILGSYETKQQISLFVLLFILYGIVLALTIARRLPSSEKYFLHVKGEVKEMDIALYKWLRQSPDAFVAIGRSVDCNLHITWDTESDIAPVHARITQVKGIPHISTADGDVIVNNRFVPDGKLVRLHHGMSFQIGTTTFTFVEM